MQTVSTIGLDIAKSVFQVHGVDANGQVVIRRQLKRRYVLAFFEKLPPCLVGIEACASSHHWSRELQALGHTVRLMPPAYVKPYVKRQKNDMADAEAICEAVTRAKLAEARDMDVAAHSLGLQLTVLDASSESEIDRAFAVFAEHKLDALIINTDPFLLGQRQQIVQLAARHNIPAVYFLREFVDAGGLMSYGPSVANSYRQVGIYVGRILKGENAGDLPVVQPTAFELVINLKTAKALGLTFPPSFRLRADEVIE